MPKRISVAIAGLASLLLTQGLACAQPVPAGYLFNDARLRLTNSVQPGDSLRDFPGIMGPIAGRVALSGIPLQQQWSYRDSGAAAPVYHLDTDAPLYCCSFTDVFIAQAYLSLPPEQKQTKVLEMDGLLSSAFTPEAGEKVRKTNCERIFGAARVRVRRWERLNAAGTRRRLDCPGSIYAVRQ